MERFAREPTKLGTRRLILTISRRDQEVQRKHNRDVAKLIGEGVTSYKSELRLFNIVQGEPRQSHTVQRFKAYISRHAKVLTCP